MIEVAVRQDDAVHRALDFIDSRERLFTGVFRVHAAVNHHAQASEFEEHAAGADFAARVKVSNSHSRGSVGGIISKAGMRTKIRCPSSVVPWKAPSAVTGWPVR